MMTPQANPTDLGLVEAHLRAHPLVHSTRVSKRTDAQGREEIVAVVAVHACPEDEADQVALWREIYDATYSRQPASCDPTFNIVGWTSCFDRKPIPAAQMRAWVEETVGRISAEAGRRILEIGCGTGLLLFRLAAHTELYCATDISARALEYVARVSNAEAPRETRHICLVQCAAHDFSQLPRDFDLVILNSVAQHFPSERYLREVIRHAAARLGNGGKIYIGDVRDLSLLRALHAWSELQHAAPDLTLDKLNRRVERAVSLVRELAISREFFLELPQRIPGIEHVELILKSGDYSVELSLFRYDVILHTQAPPLIDACCTAQWSESMDAAEISRRLQEELPDLLHIAGIIHPHLARHRSIAARIAAGEPSQSVQTLRDVAQSSAENLAGVEPKELAEVGATLGYDVELHATGARDPARFDVVFRRAAVRTGMRRALPPMAQRAATGDEPRTNRSSSIAHAEALRKQLRDYAAAHLPVHLVPDAFVIEDAPKRPE